MFYPFLTAVKIIPKLYGRKIGIDFQFLRFRKGVLYDSGQSAFVSKKRTKDELSAVVQPCPSMQPRGIGNPIFSTTKKIRDWPQWTFKS